MNFSQICSRVRPQRFARILTPILLFFAAEAVFLSSAAAKSSSCDIGSSQAALANSNSLQTLRINLFGNPEKGWAFYVPLISNEIGTECSPTDPGFASAFGEWQKGRAMRANGVVDIHALAQMKVTWQQRRPFVRARYHEICPAPPSSASLTKASADESYGKEIEILPDALAAYRRLVGAARSQGVISPGSPIMTIFSGFRAPEYDDARCKTQKNCDGTRRAKCSNHRTGLAIDVYLGSAPDFRPDSTAQVNREFVARSAAYHWLLNNAKAFGFVNYPYEPWHWEYIGTT